MNIARLWLGAAAALGVLSLILLGVVAWPMSSIRAQDAGGACAGWSGGQSRTMTAAMVVRNDSGSDAHVLGVSATKQDGAGTVRYRAIAGVAVHTGYGTAARLADGHPIVAANGVVLPAHTSSTLLVTATVAPGESLLALGRFDVSIGGPLGTVRSSTLDTTLGFMAPGHTTCDLAAVS